MLVQITEVLRTELLLLNKHHVWRVFRQDLLCMFLYKISEFSFIIFSMSIDE